MNQQLKETIGYIALGFVFFSLAFWWFDLVAFIMKWVFYIGAVILVLAGLGSLSEYFNSPSVKYKPSRYKNLEQKGAEERVEFAKANNVTTPFFSADNGKIFRTSDGKAYPQHVGFFEDGGATDWSNVTVIS